MKVVPQSTVKDNPWGVVPAINPEPCSLSVLMDEELARKLDEEERNKETPVEPVQQNLTLDDNVASDFLLAQMLQYEFDRENDKYVAAREKHVNGNSKGSSVLVARIITHTHTHTHTAINSLISTLHSFCVVQ